MGKAAFLCRKKPPSSAEAGRRVLTTNVLGIIVVGVESAICLRIPTSHRFGLLLLGLLLLPLFDFPLISAIHFEFVWKVFSIIRSGAVFHLCSWIRGKPSTLLVEPQGTSKCTNPFFT